MNSGRRLVGRSAHAKPLGWWTVWGLQLLGGHGGPISLVYGLVAGACGGVVDAGVAGKLFRGGPPGCPTATALSVRVPTRRGMPAVGACHATWAVGAMLVVLHRELIGERGGPVSLHRPPLFFDA